MTASQLVKLFPRSKIYDFFPYWDEAMSYAEINTPERTAMFLAQIGHECQGFTRFEENLKYTATGLAKTWPNRFALFPNEKAKSPNRIARAIANNPEMIANTVYANRMGNGDFASGDGWKYRGKGPGMTTGYDNHKEFDDHFDLDGKIIKNPELLLLPQWGIKATVFFWKSKNMNAFSDKKDIIGGRKRLNGGIIGLDKVEELYNKILSTL